MTQDKFTIKFITIAPVDSFAEQFPSLMKTKRVNWTRVWDPYGDIQAQIDKIQADMRKNIQKEIQANCKDNAIVERDYISKQKVRDAIYLQKKFYERTSVDRYKDRLQQGYAKNMLKFIEELEKELGL